MLKTVKNALRQLTPSWARNALTRIHRSVDPYWRPSYAQEGEDLVLERLFEGVRAGFYVDVGAHHPLRYSNTYAFYVRGWRGINVDPDPDAAGLFARLRPQDTFVNAGVSDEPGSLTYYRFNEPALNTFDSVLAEQRARLDPYRIVDTTSVPVTTLSDILYRHLPAGHEIAFLTVDVEGYDLRVLRSNDWRRFRPQYVLSESLGSSIATLASDPQCRFLGTVGYEPFAKTANTVFYQDVHRQP